MTTDVKDALAELIGKTQDAKNATDAQIKETREDIAAGLGSALEIAKNNSTSIDELRGKADEYGAAITTLTTEMKTGFEDLSELKKSATDHTEALDALLKSERFGSVAAGEAKPDDEMQKSAVTYYKSIHDFHHKGDKGAPAFNPNAIDADKVKEYATVRSGFAKMIRSDAAAGMGFGFTPEEQKAISTISHGDRYFLPTEISNQVIRCFTDESDIVGLFQNVNMSGHNLVMPIEPQEGVYAEWTCEGSCDSEDSDLQQWGNLTLTPQEIRAKGCVTRTMARDSAIDVEQALGNVARRSFTRQFTRDYVSSSTKGGMQGAFEKGNHVNVMTSESLKVNPIDLVRLAKSFPSQFRNGARWMMNCNTEAFICTMQKPNGDFYFDLDSDTLLRYPVVTVDQFADLQDENGALVGGTKALALVNPSEHYVLGRREEFQAQRNPYSKMNCGLIEWFFYMSVAGAVKCPNAFRALQIKE